jgi:UDP-N-acetylglucosamine acyltransferase
MTTIHPAAVVDSSAQLADDVEVGAYAIIEGDVSIGTGTVIRPHAVVRQYTHLGAGNYVDSFVTLGGEPQDYKFDADTESYLRIGDANVFREGVTISRATTPGGQTRVGDNTYWMNNAHAGHDSTIGDRVILPTSSAVAGHARIDDGAILPANGNIHQFCFVGRKVMFQGSASTSMHVPPYVLCADINKVIALNVVGLRRDPAISDEDRRQIKEAFDLLYRKKLTPAKALQQMDTCRWGEAADAFRSFLREAISADKPFNRGISPMVNRCLNRRGGG